MVNCCIMPLLHSVKGTFQFSGSTFKQEHTLKKKAEFGHLAYLCLKNCDLIANGQLSDYNHLMCCEELDGRDM